MTYSAVAHTSPPEESPEAVFHTLAKVEFENTVSSETEQIHPLELAFIQHTNEYPDGAVIEMSTLVANPFIFPYTVLVVKKYFVSVNNAVLGTLFASEYVHLTGFPPEK